MTPYGTAKRMAEAWAIEYERAYGLPVVINRPGTIYGPGQEGSPESGWIAWFLKAKKQGLKVTINGDGHQVRDLLYVYDYCGLIMRQIEDLASYAGRGRIWDVGGGTQNIVSVLEMADYLGLDYEFGPPRDGDADAYVGINDTPTWGPTTYWKDTEMFR
jgi:CDP-paratose 2-epimerase